MVDIPGYEGRYAVTEDGQVWSYLRRKYLKQDLTYRGYKKVHLINKDGKDTYEGVHRLVALAYIPNPDNLETVNHKDEDKTNNNVDNLEWMSRADNIRYGTAAQRGAITRSKPIVCLETGVVYDSLTAAANDLGLAISAISQCCSGKAKSTHGYHFQFATGI